MAYAAWSWCRVCAQEGASANPEFSHVSVREERCGRSERVVLGLLVVSRWPGFEVGERLRAPGEWVGEAASSPTQDTTERLVGCAESPRADVCC